MGVSLAPKNLEFVASLAEAWIEITDIRRNENVKLVASLAEAWIEILVKSRQTIAYMSPPSRRRGLKCKSLVNAP